MADAPPGGSGRVPPHLYRAVPALSATGPRLLLEGVHKTFGTARAVDGVSLAISEGEFVTLLGASGCGKTTLLRIAAGFTAPDSGRVVIDGAEATSTPPAARGMGFVFQSYALFPTKTTAENIGFALRVAGRPKAQIAARVQEVAALVAITPLLGRYPHEMSGGQQQRVALARAIAPAPRMLLLDEPLAALDARIRHRLRDEIRALTDRLGMTALYVTHDQEEALAISDRVVVMRDGRIEQAAPPAEVYLRPASRFVAEFVGQATLLETEVIRGVPRALGIDWPGTAQQADGAWLMVLRPEELAADPQGPLAGAVDSIRYLGAVLRVGVVLDCGTRLTADLPARAQRPALGERLGLRPVAAPALVPP